MRKNDRVNFSKAFLLTALLLITLFLCGCAKRDGKNAYVVNPVDADNYNASCDVFSRILKGEQGLYFRGYSSRLGAMDYHYYDEPSGKSVYLCSKPECLHSGDELCVATNENYLVGDDIFYDGKIYCAAYTTNELKFVLLRLEPDGSALTEVTTLKESVGATSGFQCGEMYIHRGYVFASYGYVTEDKLCAGTIVYNLLDGTRVELPEYEYKVSLTGVYRDSPNVRCNYKASEDYVYFNELRPINERKNKRYLCRYNLGTSKIEEVPIDVMYQGTYCMTSPSKVVYTDKFGHLYKYDFENDETMQCNDIYTPVLSPLEDGTYVLWPDAPTITAAVGDFLCYRGDLYALLSANFNDVSYYHGDFDTVKGLRPFMAKLDDQLEVVGDFIDSPFTDPKLQAQIGTDVYASPVKYSVIGDDLYIEFFDKLVQINLLEFLNGNVEYKIIVYNEQ